MGKILLLRIEATVKTMNRLGGIPLCRPSTYS